MENQHLIVIAEDVLALRYQDSLDSKKASFLRRLDDVALMPTVEMIESAIILGILPNQSTSYQYLYARADRELIERVDDFASKYWELNPAERIQQLNELHELATQFPRQQFRLSELKSGLDLELPKSTDSSFEPLIECIETAYILPRLTKSMRIREILQRALLKSSDLQKMSALFLKANPAFQQVLASLELTKTDESFGKLIDDLRRKKSNRVASSKATEEKTSKILPLAAITIIFFVIGLIKAGISSRESSPPSIKYPTNFTPPTIFQQPQFPKFNQPELPHFNQPFVAPRYTLDKDGKLIALPNELSKNRATDFMKEGSSKQP